VENSGWIPAKSCLAETEALFLKATSERSCRLNGDGKHSIIRVTLKDQTLTFF
jgi:hypothetical protein